MDGRVDAHAGGTEMRGLVTGGWWLVAAEGSRASLASKSAFTNHPSPTTSHHRGAIDGN
jgi:hypothetical protein